MTTETERRRSPRIPCHNVWLEVKIGDQASIIPPEQLPARRVRVDNISDTGICLVSAEPFELSQTIYFFDSNLPAQGTVVWTCKSALEGSKAGIQFNP